MAGSCPHAPQLPFKALGSNAPGTGECPRARPAPPQPIAVPWKPLARYVRALPGSAPWPAGQELDRISASLTYIASIALISLSQAAASDGCPSCPPLVFERVSTHCTARTHSGWHLVSAPGSACRTGRRAATAQPTPARWPRPCRGSPDRAARSQLHSEQCSLNLCCCCAGGAALSQVAQSGLNRRWGRCWRCSSMAPAREDLFDNAASRLRYEAYRQAEGAG